MSNEIDLTERELLEHLDFWKIRCKSFWNRIDNRAYVQIVALITDTPEKGKKGLTGMAGEIFNEARKSQASKEVTEEWIEEKARGMEQLYINCDGLFSRFLLNLPHQLTKILKEVGVEVAGMKSGNE